MTPPATEAASASRYTFGGRTATFVRRFAPPPSLWAYLAPSLLAALAVQFWFRDDAGLAGGDLPPPIAPGHDYVAHWNQVGTGVGGPTNAIVSLPYYEGLNAFKAMGLGEVAFQRLWLTMLFAASAAAVVFLADQLLRSGLAAAIAGCLVTFNAYRLTVGFDSVPLAALIASGVLGGLVIRAAREDRDSPPIVFALASLTLGFVFVNPPHLVLVLVWVAISVVLGCAAFGRPAARRIGRFLLMAAPLSVLFNLWWIVPAALTLISPVFSEHYSGVDVTQWAWTHARNNIPNILGLTSSWGWLQPEYYPYSARLERMPFAALQYTLAATAALGLLLAGRRQRLLAATLAGIGLLSIFALKGLHPPLVNASLWLYDHVPGYWLFRDPSKVRLILVLVFSLLGGLGVLELRRRSRDAGTAAAVVVVFFAIIYAYPLMSGAVVAQKRPGLPSPQVKVPKEWRNAASFLDADPGVGKVVVLPRIDYYQAPSTWGYYGAPFLGQLIHRPVIEIAPGGYFADLEVTGLVDALQANILQGTGDVAGALRALGARYVLLRRDLDIRFPGRSFVPPSRLAHALVGVEALRHVRSFGLADVYELRERLEPLVYAVRPVAAGVNAEKLYRAIRVGEQTAFVSRSEGGALGGVQLGTARFMEPSTNPLRVAVTRDSQGGVVVDLKSPATRRGEGPDVMTIRLPNADLPISVARGQTHATVSRSAGAPALPPTPARAFVYRFVPETRRRPIAIPLRLEREVADCNHFDSRSAREVGLRADVLRRDGIRTVQLAARGHAACVTIPIPFEPPVPVLLRLEYRTVVGGPARVCVWVENPGRCATLPLLRSAPGWHRLGAVITPSSGMRSLRLFLYADGGGGTTTKTEYRAITVQKARPFEMVAAAPAGALPTVTARRVSPYEIEAHVTRARRPFLLVANETYAPGWRIEARGHSSEGVEHVRVNGYANGWRIPWTGTYDVKITYGPERLAQAARRFDLVLIPLSLLLWFAWRSGAGRRGRRRLTRGAAQRADATTSP